MEIIQKAVVTNAAGESSILLNNIPNTYTNLELKLSLRFARGSGANDTPWGIKLNGSASFGSRLLYAFPTGTPGSQGNTGYAGWASVSGNTANTFTAASVSIFDYASTSVYKSFNVMSTQESQRVSVGLSIFTGSWASTNAITSIEIYDQATASNVLQYSSATLYGITAGSDGTTTTS